MATRPLEMAKETPDSREFGTLNPLKIARRGFQYKVDSTTTHYLDILIGHSFTVRTR